MEILTYCVGLILFLGLIAVPILLFIWIHRISRLKFKFPLYLILATIITAGIMLTFSLWADTSNQILLKHYGYNFDGMNETEIFGNVAEDDMQRVNELVQSSSGIGWPLKAIMGFPFYSPYLLIVYLIGQLIRRLKRNRARLKSS